MLNKTYKRRGRPLTGLPKAVTMNISLAAETRQQLEIESNQTGESMAEIIRVALERHFERRK